jgi:hypothetical protein
MRRLLALAVSFQRCLFGSLFRLRQIPLFIRWQSLGFKR